MEEFKPPRKRRLRILNSMLYLSEITEDEKIKDFIHPESIIAVSGSTHVISNRMPTDNRKCKVYSSFLDLSHVICSKKYLSGIYLLYNQNTEKAVVLPKIKRHSISTMQNYGFTSTVLAPFMESLEQVTKHKKLKTAILNHLRDLSSFYCSNEDNHDKYRSVEHNNLFVYNISDMGEYVINDYSGIENLNRDINMRYIVGIGQNIRRLTM